MPTERASGILVEYPPPQHDVHLSLLWGSHNDLGPDLGIPLHPTAFLRSSCGLVDSLGAVRCAIAFGLHRRLHRDHPDVR